MTRVRLGLTTVGLLLAFAWPAAATKANPLAGVPIYEKTLYSPVYAIDRIYKSMQGPQNNSKIVLGRKGEPTELLWVTSYSTEIVGEDRQTALAADFMCHNNLNLADIARHREVFGWDRRGQPRLFTLSQGQMSVEFPAGFGMPILSDEPLILATQVLNHNLADANLKVRHKTAIEFVKDRDLRQPMKALFQQGVQGLVLLKGEDGHLGVALGEGNAEEHGQGCSLGTPASNRKQVVDAFGRRFHGHWTVPPGQQVHHTRVTDYIRLPFDTTVHAIAVHLHPFAQSLELRDLTADKTVYRSEAEQTVARIGLAKVDHYASAEGIPIHKDHEYELISVYDNTTDEPQDSMAVMFLYHWDRDFTKPTLE